MATKSFALITEGASEHQVIKHLLQHYMEEEPVINQIQPEIIDDKQQSVGGWNEVLKYCEVIIAICSETIECWLLPVCCTRDVDSRHTNQCLSHLNNELRRMNMHVITDKNSVQSRGIYQAVLKRMRKPKEIKTASTFHYGFGKFLEQLDNVEHECG